MHFVALFDHQNSKSKKFREKRLHLKCSPDRYLLIKLLTKKIKWVVKEKNHFENWQIWMNYAFVALLDHHNSKIKMFRGKRLHLKCSPDIFWLSHWRWILSERLKRKPILKIDKFGWTMHFVALLDHHNSKSKMFREKRLHLKCSTERYPLIKPFTKKIKWVIKEKNHFENNKCGWTTHFVALLNHHTSKS